VYLINVIVEAGKELGYDPKHACGQLFLALLERMQATQGMAPPKRRWQIRKKTV
jgi:hypothetical protein